MSLSSKLELSLTSRILFVNYACNELLSIELTCADLAVVHLNSSFFAYFNKGSSVQADSCHFSAFKGNYFLDPANYDHPIRVSLQKEAFGSQGRGLDRYKQELWSQNINLTHYNRVSFNQMMLLRLLKCSMDDQAILNP